MKKPDLRRPVLVTFLIFLTTVLTFPVCGQFSETIRSDRPGQANSPYTVGKKILQIQTGVEVGGFNPDGEGKGSTFYIPASFRYGITEMVEINTQWGIGWDKYTEDDYTSTAAGLNMAAFGLRFNILEENDKRPALGFEFTYMTKMLSKDYKPDYPGTKFNLIAAKSLSEQAGVNVNIGGGYNGYSGQMDGFYVINFGYAIDDEWSVFFENYSNYNADYFDTYFDFGVAKLMNDHLQLDLFAGLAGNDGYFEWFVSAGISYRIMSWRD